MKANPFLADVDSVAVDYPHTTGDVRSKHFGHRPLGHNARLLVFSVNLLPVPSFHLDTHLLQHSYGVVGQPLGNRSEIVEGTVDVALRMVHHPEQLGTWHGRSGDPDGEQENDQGRYDGRGHTVSRC